MDEPNFDPDLVEKAKEITAGPLGREMTKFPLRFAKMAFFGERPSQNKTSKINHGTVTLLELKGKQIALTCSHVLDEYRKIYTDPKVVFQLGDVDFNPFERIIAESSQLDFVSIDINGFNINKLNDTEEIKSCFFTPTSWPPEKITEL